MDDATRRQRARNKAMAKKGTFSNLPSFESRGMGRRNKRHETFPTRQCDYRIGGKEVMIRRNRKPPIPYGVEPYYMLKIVRGGLRCTRDEVAGGRCLHHLGATYESE